jgi:hypothetical protein
MFDKSSKTPSFEISEILKANLKKISMRFFEMQLIDCTQDCVALN